MSTQPTDKELQRQRKAMSLVVYPDTDRQKALRAGVPNDRADLMQRAVFIATQSGYQLKDLAWLNHDRSFTPVVELIQ